MHRERTALELATQLAANSTLSMAGNKRVLRELLHAEAALDPDVERELLALRASSFRSQDLLEGVAAFTEKRTPSWKGRWPERAAGRRRARPSRKKRPRGVGVAQRKVNTRRSLRAKPSLQTRMSTDRYRVGLRQPQAFSLMVSYPHVQRPVS